MVGVVGALGVGEGEGDTEVVENCDEEGKIEDDSKIIDESDKLRDGKYVELEGVGEGDGNGFDEYNDSGAGIGEGAGDGSGFGEGNGSGVEGVGVGEGDGI